jgi:hypothetical protein
MSKITFVILNYKRPRNLVEHILPNLLKNELIDKIIVSHALRETCFDTYVYNDRLLQLKNFEEQKKVGLYCRFLATERANTECIAFQDDDFLVDNASIKLCYEQWLEDKHSIHGGLGRNITENTYIPKDVFSAHVPVILPGAGAMTSSLTLKKVMELGPIVEPYVQDCKPLWNGEDIFLSVVAMLHTKKFNRRHDLKVQALPSPHAISEIEGHYAHRTYLVTKLFELFPELKEIFKSNN